MRRGEVYALPALRGKRGHEQAGRRYAVVVQGDYVGKLTTTTVVAPTSASALPTIYRPDVEVAGRRTLVLTEQLSAVDRSRLRRRVGRLASSEMRAVDDALKLVLGLL